MYIMNKKSLVLQSIKSSEVNHTLKLLSGKNLLKKSDNCPVCKKELIKDKIGGFMPDHKKIVAVCDDLTCIMEASFLVMRHNGNGSPILEDVK